MGRTVNTYRVKRRHVGCVIIRDTHLMCPRRYRNEYAWKIGEHISKVHDFKEEFKTKKKNAFKNG